MHTTKQHVSKQPTLLPQNGHKQLFHGDHHLGVREGERDREEGAPPPPPYPQNDFEAVIGWAGGGEGADRFLRRAEGEGAARSGQEGRPSPAAAAEH